MKGFEIEKHYTYSDGSGSEEDHGQFDLRPFPGETYVTEAISYLRDTGIVIPSSDWFYESVWYFSYPDFEMDWSKGEKVKVTVIARPMGEWSMGELIEIYEAMCGEYQSWSMRDFQESFDPDEFISGLDLE